MTVALARGRVSVRRAGNSPLLFLLPAVVPVIVFSVLPLLEGIYLGFTDAKAGINVDLAPNLLDNYSRLLSNDLFWQSFQIGIIWALSTTFLQYALGLGLALLLEQPLRFLWLARTLALVPWATPPVIVAIMWRLVYQPDIGWMRPGPRSCLKVNRISRSRGSPIMRCPGPSGRPIAGRRACFARSGSSRGTCCTKRGAGIMIGPLSCGPRG